MDIWFEKIDHATLVLMAGIVPVAEFSKDKKE